MSSIMRVKWINHEVTALTVKDINSGMVWCYPQPDGAALNVVHSLKDFWGRRKADNMYSDGTQELMLGAKTVGIAHRETSIPGVPKNNAIIERANQVIVGGAAACLVQAGMPPCCWSFAAPTFCVNYNAISLRGSWQTEWSSPHRRYHSEQK